MIYFPIHDADDSQGVPLRPLSADTFENFLNTAPAAQRAWTEGAGFKAEPGQVCALPGDDGAVESLELSDVAPPEAGDLADVEVGFAGLLAEAMDLFE